MRTITFLAALFSVLLPLRVAHACGGFFCDQAAPVAQAGERILFTSEDDGRLVTYVQVQFTGQSQDFSWVVPVKGVPEVEAGTDVLFSVLEQNTTPQFSVTTSCPNGLARGFSGGACGGASFAAKSADAAEGGAYLPRDGTDVLASGVTGPYQYVVIDADRPEDLFSWLDANGYTVTAQGRELLNTYVTEGYHLLAVKLLPGRVSGDLRPIVLRSDEPAPCIPLRLTAVAASPDMPVKAWFLGPHRAVPNLFHHVVLNDARLDWPSGGANYGALVGEAMKAAPGGMGFVTEFAGPSSIMRGTVWPAGGISLAGLQEADPQAMGNQLIALGVPFNGALQALVQRWQTQGSVTATQARADVEAEILAPLRRAQALVDAKPYLTRLYTTISPEDMLADPTFTYSEQMPEVSNLHVAKDTSDCNAGPEDPVVLDLPSGHTLVFTEGTSGPTVASAGDAGPAALRVEAFDEAGLRTVVSDAGDGIPQRLEVGSGGCVGCRAGARGGAMWLGTLLILLLLRRRP